MIFNRGGGGEEGKVISVRIFDKVSSKIWPERTLGERELRVSVRRAKSIRKKEVCRMIQI